MSASLETSKEAESNLRFMPWRSPSDFEAKGEVVIALSELLGDCRYEVHQHPFLIKRIELRKYMSWFEYRHEFIIMACSPLDALHDPAQEYFLRIDRAWDAPQGWRQYIPFEWMSSTLFPRFGSSKPASNEVVISKESPSIEGTQSVAALRLTDQLMPNGDIKPAAMFRNFAGLIGSVGKYALFGANCWSVSRTMLVSTFYQWSECQAVDIWLHGKRATYHAFRKMFSTDVWVSESMLPFHQSELTSAFRPDHSPGIGHRLSVIWHHFSRDLPGRLLAWLQACPSSTQSSVVARINCRGWEIKDGALCVSGSEPNAVMGQPFLEPRRALEVGIRNLNQPSNAVLVAISLPLHFETITSITFALPLGLGFSAAPKHPRAIYVALLREVYEPVQPAYVPIGASFRTFNDSRSNLRNVDPDTPLHLLKLKRRPLPFDSISYLASRGGAEMPWWIKVITDPMVFFDGELQPGDRISVWLDGEAEGVALRAFLAEMITVTAKWKEVPPPFI